jgi:putative transposase
MKLENHTLYHVFNQGNNREILFKKREDYLDFLKKVKFFVKPNCDFLSYCLMPNHFHFLILTNDKSVSPITVGNIELQELTNAFRTILSTYAREFNKRNSRTGSLFRQKTKFELIDNGDSRYPKRVFDYVLSNPLKAGLVTHLDNWEYSAYLDFIGKRSGNLCDIKMAEDIFQFEISDLKDLNLGFGEIPGI